MKNPHLVVGAERRCVCGSYEGHGSIHCADVIRTLKQLDHWLDAERNPSLLVPKGGRVPLPPTAAELARLAAVLRPLIQDCP